MLVGCVCLEENKDVDEVDIAAGLQAREVSPVIYAARENASSVC